MQKTQLNTVQDTLLFPDVTGDLAYCLTNDYMFLAVMQRNEKVLRKLIGSLLG